MRYFIFFFLVLSLWKLACNLHLQHIPIWLLNWSEILDLYRSPKMYSWENKLTYPSFSPKHNSVIGKQVSFFNTEFKLKFTIQFPSYASLFIRYESPTKLVATILDSKVAEDVKSAFIFSCSALSRLIGHLLILLLILFSLYYIRQIESQIGLLGFNWVITRS